MTISSKQYQSLQTEACRMAEELPKTQLLDSLVASSEAGRLLHMTKTALVGPLGSVAMRCIDDQLDDAAPPVAPAARMWTQPGSMAVEPGAQYGSDPALKKTGSNPPVDRAFNLGTGQRGVGLAILLWF